MTEAQAAVAQLLGLTLKAVARSDVQEPLECLVVVAHEAAAQRPSLTWEALVRSNVQEALDRLVTEAREEIVELVPEIESLARYRRRRGRGEVSVRRDDATGLRPFLDAGPAGVLLSFRAHLRRERDGLRAYAARRVGEDHWTDFSQWRDLAGPSYGGGGALYRFAASMIQQGEDYLYTLRETASMLMAGDPAVRSDPRYAGLTGRLLDRRTARLVRRAVDRAYLAVKSKRPPVPPRGWWYGYEEAGPPRVLGLRSQQCGRCGIYVEHSDFQRNPHVCASG